MIRNPITWVQKNIFLPHYKKARKLGINKFFSIYLFYLLFFSLLLIPPAVGDSDYWVNLLLLFSLSVGNSCSSILIHKSRKSLRIHKSALLKCYTQLIDDLDAKIKRTENNEIKRVLVDKRRHAYQLKDSIKRARVN